MNGSKSFLEDTVLPNFCWIDSWLLKKLKSNIIHHIVYEYLDSSAYILNKNFLNPKTLILLLV